MTKVCEHGKQGTDHRERGKTLAGIFVSDVIVVGARHASPLRVS